MIEERFENLRWDQKAISEVMKKRGLSQEYLKINY